MVKRVIKPRKTKKRVIKTRKKKLSTYAGLHKEVARGTTSEELESQFADANRISKKSLKKFLGNMDRVGRGIPYIEPSKKKKSVKKRSKK